MTNNLELSNDDLSFDSSVVNKIITNNKNNGKISKEEIAHLISVASFEDLLPLSLSLGRSPLDVKYRRPMFRPMFTKTRKAPRIVYRCARQLGKSLSVAASILMNMIYRQDFNALYCTPLSLYTNRLSHVYLDPLTRSCSVPWNVVDKRCVQNVCEKTYSTGGHYYGVSCFANAGQALGIPNICSIYFDEVQDLDTDLIPQLLQCSSANVEFGWETYTGTARGMDNTIETLWSHSSQNIWHIKCPRCSHVNVASSEESRRMIQKAGIGCSKCSTSDNPMLLNVDKGWWEPMFPEREEEFQGFHVPQIFISDRARVDTEAHYKAYHKNIYSRLHGVGAWAPSRFDQEILGLSTEGGSRPLSPEQLKEACCLQHTMESPAPVSQYTHITGGADWGGSEVVSFTIGVVTGRHLDGTFHVLGAIRPLGLRQDEQPFPVGTMMKRLGGSKLSLIGADGAYVGALQNRSLSMVTGVPCASLLYASRKSFYGASGGKDNVFTVDRSTLIFCTYSLIISGKIKMPAGTWFDIFSNDLLSISIEETDTPSGTVRRYARTSGKADDFLHALGYSIFMLCISCSIDLPSLCGLSLGNTINRKSHEDIGD